MDNPNPNGPASSSDQGDTTPETDTGTSPGGDQQDPSAGKNQLGPDGQPWDPARAETLIANLRQEIATLKGKQGSQEPAPQQPEPDAGQAPDDDTAEQLRAATTQLAVYQHAGKHGANPTALTDSMSFMDKVAKLDPAAADYTTKLGDAIKKAVTDHPHYASGQAPGGSPRGGSDGTGRPGAPNRPRGINGAVSAHYSKK